MRFIAELLSHHTVTRRWARINLAADSASAARFDPCELLFASGLTLFDFFDRLVAGSHLAVRAAPNFAALGTLVAFTHGLFLLSL